jgi:hypothetical protein
VHAIDPHVDVVAIGKAPLLEGPVLGLPLVGQPRDVRGGQTAGIVPLQRRERPHGRGRHLRPAPPPRPPGRAKGPVTEKGGQPRQLTTTPRRFAPITIADPSDHEGLAALRSQMPDADLRDLERDRRLSRIDDLFTVDLLSS